MNKTIIFATLAGTSLLLGACGPQSEDQANSQSADQTDSPLIENPLKAPLELLDKAKKVEGQLQDSLDRRMAEIDGETTE